MVSRDRGSGGLDRGVEAVGWRVRASIITDKLPSFYLASCFPLVKYSVILLLTVSNTVTNAVDLYKGFSVRCCAYVGAAVAAAWAGFSGVGQGKAGQKRKKPEGGATDTGPDDNATPAMSLTNCAA